MRLLALILAALAAPASAQGRPPQSAATASHPLNGTWRIDPKSAQLPARPDVFAVKDGVYSCQSCTPSAYQVAADGAFHKVAGRDYWDEIAVDASAPDTLAMRFRRGGKDVGESSISVSKDGKTLTRVSKTSDNPESLALENTTAFARVSPAPEGAHRASGGWKPVSVDSPTDAALTLTYKIDGDTVAYTSPTGESYTARIGGPAMPMDGDPSGLMVRVARPGPNQLEETFLRGDDPVSVALITAAPDGKTATARVTDRRTGAVTTYTATKQ